MNSYLNVLVEECRPFTAQGKLAGYIPQLLKANPGNLGVWMTDGKAESFSGDHDTAFTIQSIIKPIMLLQALLDHGIPAVRSKVGVEATGKPFDSINMQAQTLCAENMNPMVNMGAIAVCSLIKGSDYDEKFSRVLALTRLLADNPTINVDREVYLSEKSAGSKNRALGYLLLNYHLIDDNVEDVLDCYFKLCSIRVNCRDLANIALRLANHGTDKVTGARLFPFEYGRFVNAVLMTSGMYDESGDFAIRVGIPAKSGVGGGIMAVVPNRMGIGIYSPALDKKGNSLAGNALLERLSRNQNLSLF